MNDLICLGSVIRSNDTYYLKNYAKYYKTDNYSNLFQKVKVSPK